ncbi:MAG: hypothetical protein Q7J59_02685, partial [Elusimicrobiota bacterium]|nr:hypothetical protein [Elusimicrobiota bacterium]
WEAGKYETIFLAALEYHQWGPTSSSSQGNTVNTSSLLSGKSINRNENSADTDEGSPLTDWRITGHTKGYKNDWTVPGAITALYAVETSTEGVVQLSWTAPGDDGTNNNNTGGYYEVRYSSIAKVSDYASEEAWWNAVGTTVKGGQGSVNFSSPKGAGEQEIRIITGLYPGNTFYFCVKTYDDVGNVSLLATYDSLWVNDSNPPKLVRAVPSWVRSSVSSSSDTITIFWLPGPLDVMEYNIWRKIGSGVYSDYKTFPSTCTSFTDIVSTGTVYTYAIRSRDIAGNYSANPLPDPDTNWLVIIVYNDYAFPTITPAVLPNAVYMKGNDFKFNLTLTDDNVIEAATIINYFRLSGAVVSADVLDLDLVAATFTGVAEIPASFVSGGNFSYFVEYGDYASRSTRTPTINVTVASSQTFTWTQGATRSLIDGNDSDGVTSIYLGAVDGDTPSRLKITQTVIPAVPPSDYSFPAGTEEERVDISINGGMPVICWDIDPKDADGYDMNVTFANPVPITLLYLDPNDDGAVDLADGSLPRVAEARLKAYFLDERNHIWRYIGGTQVTSANTLTFNFPHLSRFALFATQAGGVRPVQRFLTARTPVDFDEATRVIIYDPRGRAVVTLTTSAPTTSPIVWYGADYESSSAVSASQMVESGAYIYESTGAGGAKATGVIIVVK